MANAKLHGSLSTIEYFTFGFGTMIGVGWLVLMDDWLTRGGPGGGILGFLLRGLDDGAVIRDRVPVGGGGDRQSAGARVPRVEQLSAVRDRRQSNLRAAAR